jgi:hypothetical protein
MKISLPQKLTMLVAMILAMTVFFLNKDRLRAKHNLHDLMILEAEDELYFARLLKNKEPNKIEEAVNKNMLLSFWAIDKQLKGHPARDQSLNRIKVHIQKHNLFPDDANLQKRLLEIPEVKIDKSFMLWQDDWPIY